MYGDALLLEMVSDRDIVFALKAMGDVDESRVPAMVQSIRDEPRILDALLDDGRLFEAIRQGPDVLLHVSPYFYFSVLLRRARRELHERTFTAEWLGPRHRVPVFDAHQVAEALGDAQRLHYLADLLASFTHVRDPKAVRTRGALPAAVAEPRRFNELNLSHLRELRGTVTAAADRFALERRLGDAALMLAGVFPDSARGASEMDEWETETRQSYRQASREPLARTAGLEEILERLADDPRTARKALNFVADRFLQPLRDSWFRRSA
jgi:hypothetical protein